MRGEWIGRARKKGARSKEYFQVLRVPRVSRVPWASKVPRVLRVPSVPRGPGFGVPGGTVVGVAPVGCSGGCVAGAIVVKAI